jgi:hypothetical protein
MHHVCSLLRPSLHLSEKFRHCWLLSPPCQANHQGPRPCSPLQRARNTVLSTCRHEQKENNECDWKIFREQIAAFLERETHTLGDLK